VLKLCDDVYLVSSGYVRVIEPRRLCLDDLGIIKFKDDRRLGLGSHDDLDLIVA
jgi:hypothetical protein